MIKLKFIFILLALSFSLSSPTLANDMELFQELVQEYLRQQKQGNQNQKQPGNKQSQQRKCVNATPSDGSVRVLGLEPVGNNTWNVYYQYSTSGGQWSPETSSQINAGTLSMMVGSSSISFRYYNC